MTLSRRDRAAMVLALELLRDSAWDGHGRDSAATNRLANARDVMWLGDTFEIADAVSRHRYSQAAPRLLRARLALTLRALLRADAGDFGRYERIVSCTKHGRVGRTYYPDIRMSCDRCGHEWRERDRWSKESGDAYAWGGRVFEMPRALWQQAPAAGTAPRPEGLGRR